MSVTTRSLWPTDLKTEDVRTPLELMNEQAQLLEGQTNGILQGKVVEHIADDRRVLALEVTAPRIPKTIRLFEAQQSPDLEYPVAISPPNVKIPEYLRSEVYRPGMMEGAMSIAGVTGRWEKREWVASSPAQFIEKLEKLLASTGVRAILFNLLSRSNRPIPAASQEDPNTDEASDK